MIPCLFITWNRLEYTKKALAALLESDVDEVFIWDNASSDGTARYIMDLDHPKITYSHYHSKNGGIKEAMNWFINLTVNYEIVAKVDNDTIIPKDFCKMMRPYLNRADLIQAKHHIIEATCPGGWNTFTRSMNKIGNMYFNSFIGGSGILMRRKVLSELPDTEWLLYSWMTWQKRNPKVIKAFIENVEIELLDQHGYQDYPEYYKETKRI